MQPRLTIKNSNIATPQKPSALLLVANWESEVGYAWWLMESFWVTLARQYSDNHSVILAYPSISNLPPTIQAAPLTPVTQKLLAPGLKNLIDECLFLKRHSVKAIYFSDRPNYSLRYLAYRLCGVELIIIHDHTPGVRTAASGIKHHLKWILHRIPFVAADGLIGASNYVTRRLIEVNCAPSRRCFSVPNGIPPHPQIQHENWLRQEFHIPPNIPIAVMTGRAHNYKNIDFMLKCIAALHSEGQQLHFVFCGDGPDLTGLKDHAKTLGIESIVTFAGRRSDIPAILAQCDFAVHPSKGEVGYSLSILEYMQAGLPVVVPHNPSVCEATTHGMTGLIYEENNLAELVKMIKLLLTTPDEIKRMGENARQAILDKYDLKQTHEALLYAIARIDRNHVLHTSTN